MKTVAYLGVGSNQGDRRHNIEQAWRDLQSLGLSGLRRSPIYETDALCKLGQTMPAFLNTVFEVETDLTPQSLLAVLQGIEKGLGRETKGDWSPRTIDLDILLYGDAVIDEEDLTIPHPEMERRWFVLKPLSELVPELKHPVLKTTIKEMLWNFSSIQPT